MDWRKTFLLAVGAMDLATGVLLVFDPALTLRLMGIASMPVEPVYLSWIGVFVGSIGASYGLPYLVTGNERASRLRATLLFTALTRILVGVFVGVALMRQQLEVGWTLVAVADLCCAAVQLWLLGELS